MLYEKLTHQWVSVFIFFSSAKPQTKKNCVLQANCLDSTCVIFSERGNWGWNKNIVVSEL